MAIHAVRQQHAWSEEYIPRLQLLGDIFVNALVRKRARLELEEQLRFEKVLTEISARFINLPVDQVNSAIEDAQRQVCECLYLEFSGLWQLVKSRPNALFMTHYYLPPHLSPDFPTVPENMDAREYFPWCLEEMLKGERIILSRITDAPAAANRDLELWRHYGIKSVLTLPLSAGGGTVFGALNFNCIQQEMDWPMELVDRLQLVAQIFANALARQRAEEALRESEERFDLALRGAQEGLWDWNMVTDEVYYSPRWKDMLGYAPHEIEPHISAWQRLLHPDDRARASQVVDEVMRDEREYAMEFRLQHNDGHYVDILSRGFPVRREPDGPIVRIVGTHFDLTERKRLEEQLRESLEEVQQLRDRLQMENVYLREQLRRDDGHTAIVGESKPILQMLDAAKKVAPTDSTVLLLGETGTGKELLAHAIHDMSPRKDRMLVLVNCASLPPTLIESELFGREKGAYTGSLTKMIGRFELADESTLFLDEIGDLPLELQSKLLRVLEQGQFERLGSSRTIKVNVRLIAATNHDLARDVNDGRFRKDLYYRLNVFPITIPPLRDRAEDIPSLVWSFVNQFEKSLGKQIESIPKQNMEGLMRYPWPGNIRELRNVIEHAMIMCTTPILKVAPPAWALQEQSATYSLADNERRHILEVLERTGWRLAGKHGAAELLGMKRTTLQSKMKALGITRSVT